MKSGGKMVTMLDSKTNDKVEKIANVLREKTFQTDYYAEVINIALQLGLPVYKVGFDNDNISGFIEVDEENPETNKICVNKNHCDARQRFTIAHEIGHYVLEHLNSDCKKYRKVDFDNNDYSPEETQANKFAAVLLMPESMIREVWQKFSDIKILAATFGVSEGAASYRIKNLNLG